MENSLELQLVAVGTHLGALFFFALLLYMLYLRPVSMLEKAVTFHTFCLVCVCARAVEYRYFQNSLGLSWFGAFAWLSLIVSFGVILFAITRQGFGKKGKNRENIKATQ